MPFRRRFFFLAAFFLLVILAGGFFNLSRILKSPERLYDSLVTQIEKQTGAQLSFQEAKFIFSPFPVLWLKRPHLESASEGIPNLSAEEVRFPFRFFPLLLGQIRLSGFQMQGGEGAFWGIPLEKMEFKVRGLYPKRSAPFEWRASLPGGREILKGKGSLSFQSLGDRLLKDLALQAHVTFSSFSSAQETGQDFLKYLPPVFRSGEWTGTLQVNKERGADAFEGLSRFEVKDFQAAEATEAFTITGESKLFWDSESKSLEFEQFLLKTPFGEIETGGTIHAETGEVKEARLRGRKVILEELVRHFPRLNSFLPVDMGFSGESEFDLSLNGAWDYLSLNANWNLSSAILTYGKIFSKPKDLPLSIHSDFLLKEGSFLSGDFSVRIGKAMVKGTLASLNLKTGAVELTLLTNKFDLGEGAVFLTPFAHYQLSGSAKVLLSLKGNLTQLREAEKMFNLTLDKAGLISPTGAGIEEATVQFDISPLSLGIKDSIFKIGGSLIQMDTEIYNFPQAPQGKLEILSPQLSPFDLLKHLEELTAPFLDQKKPVLWDKVGQTLHSFFPNATLVEDLSLRMEMKPNQTALQNLSFRALDGEFKLQGERNISSGKQNSWLEVELKGVHLARYFEGMGNAGKSLDGNLFLNGRFEFSQSLTGRGTVSITNGEWHRLDLFSPLRSLEFFEGLDAYRSSSLPFHDLKVSWNYKEGKFDTDDLLIHSEDFWIEGKGNLSEEGVLNSRLEVYLSQFLTEQVVKSWHASDQVDGKQLGPLPFLLVGSLAKPESRMDSQLAQSFLEAIRARRYRRILREPFKESKKKPVLTLR